MIDIHTHCLPEFDDGAKDCDESRAMLEDSFRQGVEICVATPHCVVHESESIADFIQARNEAFEKLKRSVESVKDKCPEILLGAEVYLDNDISKYQDVRALCIGNTRYMLTELPSNTNHRVLSEWLYNLQMCDIKPIIAHIDRCKNWREVINEVSAVNVLYQVNASRFLSFEGRRLIKKLLEHTGEFIVSSDMHNMTSRKCNMQQAREKALKKYGGTADDMFGNTARKILCI